MARKIDITQEDFEQLKLEKSKLVAEIKKERDRINALEKQLIKEVKAEIKDMKRVNLDPLIRKKNKIAISISNHQYVIDNYGLKDYEEGVCWNMFGKRLKDLTPEEKKLYNRETTRLSRQRKKEAKDEEFTERKEKIKSRGNCEP